VCLQKHCVCGMTHLHMGHDSLVRDIVHSYMCQARVRTLVQEHYTRDKTHSHVEHDSLVRGIVQMNHVTYERVMSHMSRTNKSCPIVHSMSRDMTRSYVT